MIAIAKQVILLADRSKIEQVSYCKVADITEIDHLFMDSGAPDSFIQKLRETGVDVTLV
ncbi:DNA-binding transcriptional regulator AgaR [compost metagenome]